MLRSWTKLLPFVIIEWLAKRRSERLPLAHHTVVMPYRNVFFAVNDPDPTQSTLFMRADALSVLRNIINAHRDRNQIFNDHYGAGETLLHTVVYAAKQSFDIRKDLAQHGIHVETPELVYLSREDVVELLLEMGANPNARTAIGQTPLQCALTGLPPSHAIVARLLAAGATTHVVTGSSPLHLAAKGGREADLALLIAAGADLNAVEKPGAQYGAKWTPLHYAAFQRAPEAVQMLLEAGADPELRDEWGRTPAELNTACAPLIEAFRERRRLNALAEPAFQVEPVQERGLEF